MSLLALSLLPLFLGPLVVGWLQSRRWTAQALDAFVTVSVGGLVLLHILPHSVTEGGVAAIVLGLLGLLIPETGSRLFAARGGVVRHLTLAVGFVALALHATLDGVALVGHEDPGCSHESVLGLAVALHRIPVGLAIWWLLRPRWGAKIAWLAVGAISLSTLAGFTWAASGVEAFSHRGWAIFQALVAGSLLHVMLGHKGFAGDEAPHQRWRSASALGGLAALALLAVLSQGHPLAHPYASTLTAGEAFWGLALLCFVPLVAVWGLIVLGQMAMHFGPSPRIAARGWRAAECLEPGAGAGLGVIALGVSLWALGPLVAALRVVTALGALVASRGWKRVGEADAPARAEPPASSGVPWQPAVELGEQAVCRVGAGLVVAALLEPLLAPEHLLRLGPELQIVLMSFVGAVTPLGALASTPLVAVLLHKGLSLGAVVAFFVTASALRGPSSAQPMTFTDIGGVARRVLAPWAVALAAGWGLNGLVGGSGLFSPPRAEWAAAPLGPVAWTSLVVVGALGVLCLLRHGAEGFVRGGLALGSVTPHQHFPQTDSEPGCSSR